MGGKRSATERKFLMMTKKNPQDFCSLSLMIQKKRYSFQNTLQGLKKYNNVIQKSFQNNRKKIYLWFATFQFLNIFFIPYESLYQYYISSFISCYNPVFTVTVKVIVTLSFYQFNWDLTKIQWGFSIFLKTSEDLGWQKNVDHLIW